MERKNFDFLGELDTLAREFQKSFLLKQDIEKAGINSQNLVIYKTLLASLTILLCCVNLLDLMREIQEEIQKTLYSFRIELEKKVKREIEGCVYQILKNLINGGQNELFNRTFGELLTTSDEGKSRKNS